MGDLGKAALSTLSSKEQLEILTDDSRDPLLRGRAWVAYLTPQSKDSRFSSEELEGRLAGISDIMFRDRGEKLEWPYSKAGLVVTLLWAGGFRHTMARHGRRVAPVENMLRYGMGYYFMEYLTPEQVREVGETLIDKKPKEESIQALQSAIDRGISGYTMNGGQLKGDTNELVSKFRDCIKELEARKRELKKATWYGLSV